MSIKGKGVISVDATGDGRVKQEFKKVSDINDIVRRYQRNGVFDYVARSRPAFADVSNVGDFRSMVARVRAAQEAFDLLPAIIRTRFHNSSTELVEFLQNGDNRDEAIKLGLIEAPKAPVPEPAPAKVVIVGDDREDPAEDPPAKPRKK